MELVNSTSAMPVEMLATFLRVPWRIRGMKAWIVRTRPSALTWKEERKSASRVAKSSGLLEGLV